MVFEVEGEGGAFFTGVALSFVLLDEGSHDSKAFGLVAFEFETELFGLLNDEEVVIKGFFACTDDRSGFIKAVFVDLTSFLMLEAIVEGSPLVDEIDNFADLSFLVSLLFVVNALGVAFGLVCDFRKSELGRLDVEGLEVGNFIFGGEVVHDACVVGEDVGGLEGGLEVNESIAGSWLRRSLGVHFVLVLEILRIG